MVSHASLRLRLLTGALLLGGLSLLAGAVLPRTKTLEQVIAGIQEKSVTATLQILGGKAMQGRGTFSPGFDRAAEFVEGQLKALGLEPAGTEGTFRLQYTMPCVTPAVECSVRWPGMPDGENAPQLGKDFAPLLGSRAGAVEAEAVFAGFGIQSKDENWSDYKEKDVRGKILFAFTREPWADDAKQKRFGGALPVKDSGVHAKAMAAAEAGALGLVFVPDPAFEPDAGLAMIGTQSQPTLYGVDVAQVENRMDLPPFPVMSVSRAMASAIFGTDIGAYHAEIERKKKSKPLFLEARVRLETRFHEAPVTTYNLAARIRGTGANGEVLVLGAHLDHVGWGVHQEFSDSLLQVFPGADDNASGSTALLEVAKAFAGVTPAMDILFLWFSAEELGLVGSAAYCEAPLYPMESTVAMLNMDQIARTDPKEFNLGGTWERKDWADFVTDQAKRARCKLKIDFKAGRDLYGRSDQYSFHQKGVPALFFFEGNLDANPVYHKPGDVTETIDCAKMTDVARVFAACAYAIAVEGVHLR
jgi:hypothetical protein